MFVSWHFSLLGPVAIFLQKETLLTKFTKGFGVGWQSLTCGHRENAALFHSVS